MEESNRPTERAIQHYVEASNVSQQMTPNKDNNELIRYLGWIMREMAKGDAESATGLRATYILLEKVDQRLARIEQSIKR